MRGYLLNAMARGASGRGRGRASGGRGSRRPGTAAVPVQADDPLPVGASGSSVDCMEVSRDTSPDGLLVRSPRFDRRDYSDKALRALQAKYTSTRLEVLSGAVDDRGVRLIEFVADKIQELDANKKKLTSAFWMLVDKKFPSLRTSPADSLTFPQTSENVSKDMLDALSIARHGSPALKSTEPLKRYLSYCETLSTTEVIGIAQQTQEDAFVTRKAALNLQFALLGTLARNYVKIVHRFNWDFVMADEI